MIYFISFLGLLDIGVLHILLLSLFSLVALVFPKPYKFDLCIDMGEEAG